MSVYVCGSDLPQIVGAEFFSEMVLVETPVTQCSPTCTVSALLATPTAP